MPVDGDRHWSAVTQWPANSVTEKDCNNKNSLQSSSRLVLQRDHSMCCLTIERPSPRNASFVHGRSCSQCGVPLSVMNLIIVVPEAVPKEQNFATRAHLAMLLEVVALRYSHVTQAAVTMLARLLRHLRLAIGHLEDWRIEGRGVDELSIVRQAALLDAHHLPRVGLHEGLSDVEPLAPGLLRQMLFNKALKVPHVISLCLLDVHAEVLVDERKGRRPPHNNKAVPIRHKEPQAPPIPRPQRSVGLRQHQRRAAPTGHPLKLAAVEPAHQVPPASEHVGPPACPEV
mmetsp:Transcript_27938/g.69099  ORF Transcript_27938/g.69099 Transcript_27938/m.69099 type:complete len:286 (+) Transcript_27938:281-1138(+)